MTFTVKLDHGGGTHPAHLHDGTNRLHVFGAQCANADCDAHPLAVGYVSGSQVRSDRTIEADAGCFACGKTIGRIVAELDTIFGAEEDAAICARARVYT